MRRSINHTGYRTSEWMSLCENRKQAARWEKEGSRQGGSHRPPTVGFPPETLALQRGSEGQGQGGSWQAFDGSDIEPPLLSRGFILKT